MVLGALALATAIGALGSGFASAVIAVVLARLFGLGSRSAGWPAGGDSRPTTAIATMVVGPRRSSGADSGSRCSSFAAAVEALGRTGSRHGISGRHRRAHGRHGGRPRGPHRLRIERIAELSVVLTDQAARDAVLPPELRGRPLVDGLVVARSSAGHRAGGPILAGTVHRGGRRDARRVFPRWRCANARCARPRRRHHRRRWPRSPTGTRRSSARQRRRVLTVPRGTCWTSKTSYAGVGTRTPGRSPASSARRAGRDRSRRSPRRARHLPTRPRGSGSTRPTRQRQRLARSPTCSASTRSLPRTSSSATSAPRWSSSATTLHMVMFALDLRGELERDEIDIVLGDRFLLTSHPRSLGPVRVVAHEAARRRPFPLAGHRHDALRGGRSDRRRLFPGARPARRGPRPSSRTRSSRRRTRTWSSGCSAFGASSLEVRHTVTPEREVFNQLTNREVA